MSWMLIAFPNNPAPGLRSQRLLYPASPGLVFNLRGAGAIKLVKSGRVTLSVERPLASKSEGHDALGNDVDPGSQRSVIMVPTFVSLPSG